MDKNWTALIKPRKLQIIPGMDASREADIVVEPLERGFGTTLGNALRRILLSSLRGAAVVGVRVNDVVHEFSSIRGVHEDLTDIILNIKALAIKMHSDHTPEQPRRVFLSASEPGAVLAGRIDGGADFEVLDPDHVICTLDAGASLDMELHVATGNGYVPASRNRDEEAQIGLIPIDAIYSPVRKVAFKVENSRVGQVTDYDRLAMSVETNGRGQPRGRGGPGRHASSRNSCSPSSISRSRRILSITTMRGEPGVQQAPAAQDRRTRALGAPRPTVSRETTSSTSATSSRSPSRR